VAYLLYMAWTTWRDKSALVVSEDLPPGSARQIVTSAVLVTLLNPKLTIFFFAFLPQFVPAGAGQPVRWSGGQRWPPHLSRAQPLRTVLHGCDDRLTGVRQEQYSEPVDGPRPGDVKGRTFPRMI
jgi:hypothetical protein